MHCSRLAKVVQHSGECCKLHHYQPAPGGAKYFVPATDGTGYPMTMSCRLCPDHVVAVLDKLYKERRGGGGELPRRVVLHISRRIKGSPVDSADEDNGVDTDDGIADEGEYVAPDGRRTRQPIHQSVS